MALGWCSRRIYLMDRKGGGYDTVSSNHERSFFVEYVLPGILALDKTSKLVPFFWCGYELQAVKEVSMEGYDLDLIKTPKRYVDALGKLTTMCEMDAVVVESSSGPISENVTHSIEDTLKIYECASASLKKEASKYKDASIKTFKQLRVFSIHVIMNEMTLSETMLKGAFTWRHVQLRSATITDKWDDRLKLVRYFELLARLVEGLRECAATEKKLDQQNLGVTRFEGRTVREALGTGFCV
ncbi:hypothetical protein BJV82DRAFT_234203 [Fennellomyces sp. T-0311]|nr:hypothetical protein BJV82DRAFT_234203 [Fennellomyces sp. T-0311]